MPEFFRLPAAMPKLAAESALAGLACRIEGHVAPYLAVELEPGQSVTFAPRALLWREASVTLRRTPAAELIVAGGPGRAGFAHAAGGTIFPLPLREGVEVQIVAERFLLAYGATAQRERVQGLGDRLTGNTGLAFDRFAAGGGGGVVWVQAAGSVFERALQDGESIDLHPGALLCKDTTVALANIFPLQELGGGYDMSCLRLTGPGRFAFHTGAMIDTAPLAVEAPRTGGLRGVAGSLLGRKS